MLAAQAPAAKEPDASAFSQILTPAAEPEQNGVSSPEPGLTLQQVATAAQSSQEGTESQRAQQSSTGDTLDYREMLRGCASPPHMHALWFACVLRKIHSFLYIGHIPLKPLRCQP